MSLDTGHGVTVLLVTVTCSSIGSFQFSPEVQPFQRVKLRSGKDVKHDETMRE